MKCGSVSTRIISIRLWTTKGSVVYSVGAPRFLQTVIIIQRRKWFLLFPLDPLGTAFSGARFKRCVVHDVARRVLNASLSSHVVYTHRILRTHNFASCDYVARVHWTTHAMRRDATPFSTFRSATISQMHSRSRIIDTLILMKH